MKSRLRWPRPLGARVAALLPRRRAADDPLVASVACGIAGLVRGLPPAALLELVYDRLGAALGLEPVFAARLPLDVVVTDDAFAADFAAYLRQLSRAELLRIAEPWLRRHVLGEEPALGAAPAVSRVEELEETLAGRDAREDARWREQRAWLMTLDGFVDELVRQRDAAQADAAATRSEAIRGLTAELRIGELEQEVVALRATVATLEARTAEQVLPAAPAPAPVEQGPSNEPPLSVEGEPPQAHPPEPPAIEDEASIAEAPAPASVPPAPLPAPVEVEDPPPPAEAPPPAAAEPPAPRALRPRRASPEDPTPAREGVRRPRPTRAVVALEPAAPATARRQEKPRPAPPAPLDLEAFKPRPVAEVTEPGHYFRCTRWSSTIAARDCGTRHTLATKPLVGGHTSRTQQDRQDHNRFERCASCEIGAELLVRLKKKPAPAAPKEGEPSAA